MMTFLCIDIVGKVKVRIFFVLIWDFYCSLIIC